MMQNDLPWISAYLFYSGSFDEILDKAVAPFISHVLEKHLAQHYFFIRYHERGPHIRLRFQCNDRSGCARLENELKVYFSEFFTAHPSIRADEKMPAGLSPRQQWLPNNSIVLHKYEPETERYGGTFGVKLSELQFEYSSRAVLSAIHQSVKWDYNRVLGCAIQMHLAFSFEAGMRIDRMIRFYNYVYGNWPSWMYSGLHADGKEEEIEVKFAKMFDQQKKLLVPFAKNFLQRLQVGDKFATAWLNEWRENMQAFFPEMNDAEKKGWIKYPEASADERLGADEKLWPVLSSYVHMTNNRLGIYNHDEAYLAFLVSACLEHIKTEE